MYRKAVWMNHISHQYYEFIYYMPIFTHVMDRIGFQYHLDQYQLDQIILLFKHGTSNVKIKDCKYLVFLIPLKIKEIIILWQKEMWQNNQILEEFFFFFPLWLNINEQTRDVELDSLFLQS